MRFKDNSPRTKSMRRWRKFGATGLILVSFGLVNIPAGLIQYHTVMAQSSTAVGQSMTFGRSKATVELKGLYTDNSRSALVARLGVEGQDGSKIPTRGSDYKVYVSSDAYPDSVKEIDVLFGFLGTDGDMFLVLPQPTEEVYSVFVMNTRYLATGQDAKALASEVTSGGGSLSALNESEIESSITNALSSYTYDPRAPQNSNLKVESDLADMISWRMTTNPADKSDRYTPIVLDTTLLEGSHFNFEGMFNKLFKESAYQELSAQHDQLSEIENSLKASIEEYESRLTINPSDSAAQKGLTEARQAQKDIASERQELASRLNTYEQLAYSDSIFSNLQTKAKVIDYDK